MDNIVCGVMFERGNALEIHNGTMFDFYPGLPHVLYVTYIYMYIGEQPVIALSQPDAKVGGAGNRASYNCTILMQEDIHWSFHW